MTTPEARTIAVPLRTGAERRAADRQAAAMPLSVEGRRAVTQDLSASGLSFASDRKYEPGARLEVVIDYLLDGHHYPLPCLAEVVRAEPTADGFLIGAKLVPDPQWAQAAESTRLRSVD
jgi:hypothetical protein